MFFTARINLRLGGMHQSGRAPMSQASLALPTKSSGCSNGAVLFVLEPDRRQPQALGPSPWPPLASCVACSTYRLDPAQRSANKATCNSERTRNNSSFSGSRHRELWGRWIGNSSPIQPGQCRKALVIGAPAACAWGLPAPPNRRTPTAPAGGRLSNCAFRRGTQIVRRMHLHLMAQ